MSRILLIKTSSLGDVVHNLPVVCDLVAAIPELTIDWVVEESFSAIPQLHSRVNRVLPAAVRRWRRGLWRTEIRDEIRAFIGQLREQRYDAIIDTQGLLKSAWIARVSRGLRHGLDWHSSREPLGLFYDRTYRVPWGQHAVERNRSLAAQALGYSLTARAQYGIAATVQSFAWLPPDRPHAVLLHATSAVRKLWPESHWVALGTMLAAEGMRCVLPWGAPDERERSTRLAQQISGAVVPERIEISALSALLAQARVVIGTDTGLTHLAGALGVPTVGLYCATDPSATGLYACAQGVNLGGAGVTPAVDQVTTTVQGLLK